MTLLEVKNLKVEFQTQDGVVSAVRDLNYTLEKGKTLAIVGESGSGKTQGAFAILGLLPKNGKASGSVLFNGTEILNLSPRKINEYRAAKIGIIFQDPMTSLNPYLRISRQLTEVLERHKGMSRSQALAESIRMLDAVRIPDAKNRIHMYPHEFSGGMRQRVMIAMSLLCGPELLIADEPTTALDVTVQAGIIDLLVDLQEDFGTSIILITHDLGIVAGSCEDTLVMFDGRVMEYRKTEELFANPQHAYTKGLLAAVPRLDKKVERLSTVSYDFLAQGREL
ncbi:MAG: ATP-binding cassette domain-containing protein [Candidatus Devosia phytovorans]|uniref:ATP-binding cassette domain-containing protein n=1 Tax=Candidatus Devosia phytovorans TaxID=3121372 RepID=A0AAJ5VVC8_9HYPH|nr:ATP-binding cassette domain-containing protein [Devosia sp.]WEK04825.1 MAG: ATP-binding cassette domain-containing protein [Devosia sp.]